MSPLDDRYAVEILRQAFEELREELRAGVVKRLDALEEALTNQEETIREQEKDIVTLKLQVQALQGRLPQVPWGPTGSHGGVD